MIEGTVGSVAAVNDAERQGSPKESAGFKIQEITNPILQAHSTFLQGKKPAREVILFCYSLFL
ncbi:hypothetical protein [Klebsiella spallanzanii]|uniref:hypothetical protein n=1 Tax=Klebsiella spallanzanii TaxID=2587528 RepID=UPI00259AD742|nr:hypothetical protein [Klebsiella spallanzanii]MDM4206256.1 hypothetical protein [Klebsiella spallanzanii]